MKDSYKAVILGEDCEVCGYNDEGMLILGNGDRFEITPLGVEPKTFRSYTLRHVSRLTFTGGQWLVDEVPLETYWASQFASPRTSESDTKVFTAWMLRDVLAEDRRESLSMEYPLLSELRSKATAVAWVEERFEDFPGQTRDPNERPLRVEFQGEIIDMVTAESPPAKAFQPIFLSSFYKIQSSGETGLETAGPPKTPQEYAKLLQACRRPETWPVSERGLSTSQGAKAHAKSSGLDLAKRFRIAFSFAGEKRDFVAEVAAILAQRFGQAAILYDKYHEAEFARRDLGIYLPELYHKHSDLVVVFVCPSYDEKEWTGLEWTAIHDLLKKRKDDEVMLCRFEHAEVAGLYSTAGFVELDGKSPAETATLILQRLALNENQPRDCYLPKETVSSSIAKSRRKAVLAIAALSVVVAGGFAVRTFWPRSSTASEFASLFKDGTMVLGDQVPRSLASLISAIQEDGDGADEKRLGVVWDRQKKLFKGMENYATSLQSILASRMSGTESAEALAELLKNLIVLQSESSEVVVPSVELAVTAYAEILRVRAARSLEDALGYSQPVIEVWGKAIENDLTQFANILPIICKAQTLDLQNRFRSNLEYRGILLRQRSELERQISQALASGGKVAESREAEELQRTDAMVAATDSWYLPLETKTKAIKDRERAGLELMDEIKGALRDWARMHKQMVAVVRKTDNLSAADVAKCEEIIREWRRKFTPSGLKQSGQDK